MTQDDLELLAQEAKKLTEGMQDRVKRNPDVADYLACFQRVLHHYDSPDNRAAFWRLVSAGVVSSNEDYNKRINYVEKETK